MIKTLKDLSSMHDDTRCHGFIIMKYWHPASGKKPEDVRTCKTEAEAQEICSRPESSFKEGDTENWWFLGYVAAGSQSRFCTMW